MILRSIYIDPDLDAQLAGRAEDEGLTKAALMRRYLVEGLRRPASYFSHYGTVETERHGEKHEPSHPIEPMPEVPAVAPRRKSAGDVQSAATIVGVAPRTVMTARQGAATKFWEANLIGTSLSSAFGEIGAPSRPVKMEFHSPVEAKKEYMKLIAMKLREGYELVADDVSTALLDEVVVDEDPEVGAGEAALKKRAPLTKRPGAKAAAKGERGHFDTVSSHPTSPRRDYSKYLYYLDGDPGSRGGNTREKGLSVKKGATKKGASGRRAIRERPPKKGVMKKGATKKA